MWVILGHSAVLAKKNGQYVPGLELGTLSWYTRPLATRPPGKKEKRGIELKNINLIHWYLAKTSLLCIQKTYTHIHTHTNTHNTISRYSSGGNTLHKHSSHANLSFHQGAKQRAMQWSPLRATQESDQRGVTCLLTQSERLLLIEQDHGRRVTVAPVSLFLL